MPTFTVLRSGASVLPFDLVKPSALNRLAMFTCCFIVNFARIIANGGYGKMKYDFVQSSLSMSMFAGYVLLCSCAGKHEHERSPMKLVAVVPIVTHQQPAREPCLDALVCVRHRAVGGLNNEGLDVTQEHRSQGDALVGRGQERGRLNA